MKVMTPFNDMCMLDALLNAGTDELYMGYHSDDWTKRFGEFTDLNRMSAYYRANGYTVDEINTVGDSVFKKGKSLFITLNANVYSQEQKEYLRNHLCKIDKNKIAGIIVSNIEVGQMVQEYGFLAVASTMCCIYNHDILRQYYNAGFRRIIIPRDVTLEDITCIKKCYPDIEVEVFLMRNGCFFSDGLCLGTHKKQKGGICAAIKKAKIDCSMCSLDTECIENTMDLLRNSWHRHACGLCALYRLIQSGVDSVKIVGRADIPSQVVSDISLVRENIDIAKSSKTEKEYLNRMVIPEWCKDSFDSMSCYYPEVRF